VSGGIAAYKSAALASQLVQAGAGVTVAMTENATRFVGEATFRGLTARPVYVDMWDPVGDADINHLALCEKADLIVVAPATANIIGKLANGIADDFVSTLLLGADSAVLLAPAMNTRMWQHPATQRNVRFLQEHRFAFIGPDEGRLACKTVGPGRMAPPEEIFDAVRERLLASPPRQQKA
jgi:phosphopantothenoylcysteine decarboxylase/phosphopantothenate--cysteine ligase